MKDVEFFSWLKSMQPTSKLTQEQVDGMNELLTVVKPEVLKDSLSKLNGWGSDIPNSSLLLSKAGADMMKRYEGFRSAPYIDMVGVPTIGYGNTYYINGSKVKMTDKHLTEEEASQLSMDIINKDFAPTVNKLFSKEIASGKLNQNMFDALISLAYNIGTGALTKSNGVTGNIHKGDYASAAKGFLAFNKGRIKGVLKPIPGLTRRRTEEMKLFLK